MTNTLNIERLEMLDTLREIISDHIKYWRQILGLARSDLKKAYTGTALGWTWAFASPAVRILVYVFAFAVGLNQGRHVEGFTYVEWLLAGLIVWFYVQKVFTGGASCIRRYKFLVTKIKFPVSLIPTITCLSELVVHGIILGAVFVIYLIGGHAPTLYWLQLPFYMLLLLLFFISWGLFAGILSTMSKDFLQFVRSISMALFWLSGIFFEFDHMNIVYRIILYLNPVAVVVKGYRNSLINGVWFWEEPWILEYVVVFTVLTTLALWMYKKLGKELPDVL